MQHLFVGYKTALGLKNKGFNERCFGVYIPGMEKYLFTLIAGEPRNISQIADNHYLAPLYQQVIDWFRIKHNIDINNTLQISGQYTSYIDFVKSPLLNLKEVKTGEYYDALNAAIEEALKLI